MWPFQMESQNTGINANSINIIKGEVIIDVRGQTCPSYLLAINKVVNNLNDGMNAKLLITCPPCGEDVKFWCKERDFNYLSMSQDDETYVIKISK